MSNITMVTHFQNMWALTSDLDYSGTATYTGFLDISDAPFIVYMLPRVL